MKRFLLYFLMLGLTALFYVLPVYGQHQIPLKKALALLGKTRNVKFVYEHHLTEKIVVRYIPEEMKKGSPEDALKLLLASTGLTYKAIGKDYFTILKNDQKKPVNELVSGVSEFQHAERNSLHSITLKGVVTSIKDGKPLESATVTIPELGLSTMTDTQGLYQFKDLLPGKITIRAQFLTMRMEDRQRTLENGQQYTVNFILEESVLSLKEVVVVATESKAGSATSSLISKAAIEHLQATSLNDVLQLLPGALAGNPDFSSVNKASIRQVNPDNMGSLGTAIIMNGTPISNNANLQVINPAKAGANASFSTSTGSGTDLRQISADNIESVEVIRGVPSAEYGDLTSGAILIKTKAGVSPLQIKARVNPTLTQLWAGEGFNLGKKKGFLNADVDYTKAYADQRYDFNAYNRLGGNLLYSNTFFKDQPLYTTTGFSYATNLDEKKQDPDDVKTQTVRKSQDDVYRFTTSGRWNLGKRFARILNYNFSANYGVQKGFQQELLTNYIYPMSYATKDTTMAGKYVPSEYLSKVWVEGKPLNIFAKVTNSFYLKTIGFNHRFLLGAEWRTDANFGSGKTYDLERPPRTTDGNASRPRSYKDIPALNQLSFYAEDNIIGRILGRALSVQLGLRYDNVQPKGILGTSFDHILAPRANFSYQLTDAFAIRAAYGITAKAPTLLYLYPQNAYFDLLNLNHYSDNPAERLVIITTRVYNTENPNLKLATNRKAELGFDLNFMTNKRLTMTAYKEVMENGYGFNTIFESVKLPSLAKYQVSSAPVGQPPVVNPVPESVTNFIADYNMPNNNLKTVNKGIEFDLDLGRFEQLRTSFILNGALMNSTSTSTANYIFKYSQTGKDPDKIAVYAPGRGTSVTRASTTLRIVHHIPQVRLIVTLAAQTIWKDSNKYLGYEALPVGYIERATGQTVWLSEAERNSDAVKSNPELYMPIQPQMYLAESWKPLWLFNLRLTKEIAKALSFSFFANNVLMDRPLEESNRWSGQYTRRNPKLFFGTEIGIRF